MRHLDRCEPPVEAGHRRGIAGRHRGGSLGLQLHDVEQRGRRAQAAGECGGRVRPPGGEVRQHPRTKDDGLVDEVDDAGQLRCGTAQQSGDLHDVGVDRIQRRRGRLERGRIDRDEPSAADLEASGP